MRFLWLLPPPIVALAPSLWGWNFSDTHPVYDAGIPHPRRSSTIVYSPCGNGGSTPPGGGQLGYACPHLLLYSTDTLLAARYDNLADSFLYGVCGGNTEQECGRCYQVEPTGGEVSLSTTPSVQLLLQVVSADFDVLPGRFRVLVGGGGFEIFTACNSDCQDRYCGGGPCVQGMYDGDFDTWNRGQGCHGSGESLLNKSYSETLASCKRLGGGLSGYKEEALWQSCTESSIGYFQQRFLSTRSLPVKCPEGLVRLTGLRRTDEDNLPEPHPQNQFATSCQGSVELDYYCLTTIHDCCMPSCYWNNKGYPDRTWARVDTCRSDGTIWDY